MSSLIGRWFGYGLGAAVGKSLFPGDDGPGGSQPQKSAPPIPQKTEAEIRADEKRFAEDEKRIEAEIHDAEK